MRKTVRSTGRLEHEILGQILRECRKAAGLTQRQLGELLERPHGFIWKIETGTQHIDIPTLLDWARLTSVEPEELIKRLRGEMANIEKRLQ